MILPDRILHPPANTTMIPRAISLLPAVLLLLPACRNDQANLSTETAIVTPTAAEVSQVVGIGRVEPEKDLVDLSATIGGNHHADLLSGRRQRDPGGVARATG